jgi:hypothetical protein
LLLRRIPSTSDPITLLVVFTLSSFSRWGVVVMERKMPTWRGLVLGNGIRRFWSLRSLQWFLNDVTVQPPLFLVGGLTLPCSALLEFVLPPSKDLP